MSRLFDLIAGWKGYAVLALACFLAGALSAWRVMSWREAARQSYVATRTVQQIVYRDRITYRVAEAFEKQRAQTAEAIRNRVREVPIHVTPEIDRAYPVPCGFVRLFNAATHGPIPDPAGCPDDAPSGIALSEVGEV